MTERQWQTRILDLARLRGWLAYHTYDSRRSQPGFPDLVIVRGDRCLFVELKSESGRPTSQQQSWLTALSSVQTVETGLWRPPDWPDVQKALR